jgi:hypothetical protein
MIIILKPWKIVYIEQGSILFTNSDHLPSEVCRFCVGGINRYTIKLIINPITINVYLKNVFLLEVKPGFPFLSLANFPPGALCISSSILSMILLFIDINAVSCDRFDVSYTRIISDVQRTRNQYYAHNYTAMIHHVEKEQCLDSLINLLKVPEILCKQSAKSALGLLEELKSSSILSMILLFIDINAVSCDRFDVSSKLFLINTSAC